MVQGFEPWLSAPYSTVKLSPRCNVLPKSTCAWLQEFVSLWILFGFGFHKVQFNSWIIACWWLSDYWPIGFPPEPIPSSFPPFFTAGRKKKTICGIQVMPGFDLSFCHWGVTDVTVTILWAKLVWQTGGFSHQDFATGLRKSWTAIQESLPLDGDQSPTAVSTRCPSSGIKSL